MEIKKHLHGLTEKEVLKSREQYGRNLITPPEETPWWKLYLEKFEDPIIVILLVATAISLIFGIVHGDFTESIGIICAVLIATGVGFWQEYDAKKKFDAMKTDKDFEPVKVRRDGVVVEVPKDQLVVAAFHRNSRKQKAVRTLCNSGNLAFHALQLVFAGHLEQ